jgi:hypothetical protein
MEKFIATLLKGKAVEFGCHPDHRLSVCKPLEKNGWDVKYFGIEGGKDIIQKFITAENINETFKENGIDKLDLLSIDIDGMDYWVWKALEMKPKRVIIEYNPQRSKGVQPYYAHNHWNFREDDYYGSSKVELIKLAQKKGYHLEDFNEENLFFVKNGGIK